MRVGDSLSQGIQLWSWDEFCQYKSMKHSECLYRHLNTIRDDKFVKKSQDFIKQIHEDPQIISQAEEQFGNTNEVQRISNTKRRSIRCGELIASFYKAVGLIDQNNKKQFEAKDFFANTKGYEFKDEQTSLGDEQTIMFDESKIKRRMDDINEKTRA